MSKIQVLDQNTINKIAAGEVIERPASVVKELVENAIDAGATAVAVELKDGGTSLIRVTDNGSGIEREDIKNAFLRHSTSKIKSVEDLFTITSLGFRGEALSSIAAIAQVELITKVKSSLTGIRYAIEGGKEKAFEEIGSPDGTTFLVRNLFFNTPARRKFLKTPTTEASHVGDLIEKLALSHPNISFKFINNNQIKLHTSGNNQLRDVIYGVYGREVTSQLLELNATDETTKIEGYIGKPVIGRGNRTFENYFVNGRYVKSVTINHAIEEAYKTYLPQHKYPFTVLHFTIDSDLLDINVHPTKMELRFKNRDELYRLILHSIRDTLSGKDLIPELPMGSDNEQRIEKSVQVITSAPEPFEKKRIEQQYNANNKNGLNLGITNRVLNNIEGIRETVKDNYNMDKGNVLVDDRRIATNQVIVTDQAIESIKDIGTRQALETMQALETNQVNDGVNERNQNLLNSKIKSNAISYTDINANVNTNTNANTKFEQISLVEASPLLSKSAKSYHRIIGQLFKTYWLVEFEEKLYIIDQHAAHERVLYERFMKDLINKTMYSQHLLPPIIVTLSLKEMDTLRDNLIHFEETGFEIDGFGGKEYAIKAVPANLFNFASKEFFIELLDSLGEEDKRLTPETIFDKIAKLSCKAAVKGNNILSERELRQLIDDLLELENPYTCPHGRPTIISMTQYELEKKFKRIQ